MVRRGIRSATVALGVLLATLLAGTGPAGADTPPWTRVGSGSTGGVSGLAPAPTGWVLVHDNKAAGQGRVALLDPAFRVTELAWPGAPPSDLESVGAVPGSPGRYVTCTSSGACFLLRIAGTRLTVVRPFRLPEGGAQNEAFAMATVAGGATVAVWADRGTATKPATVYAAIFHAGKGTFGAVTTGRVSVPWPTTGVRPVSDATVVGGRLIVSSASDNGDTGPFDSAVYEVGTVARSGSRVLLTLHAPVLRGRFPGHKVEGVACTDTTSTGLLGTDDEKLGGFVTTADVC